MQVRIVEELEGMQRVSDAVAITLKEMKDYVRPGMSTKEIDKFGEEILKSFGARSAPFSTYGFPGWTCISLNHEIAHGIPSAKRVLNEGDIVNIDVSAELNGFWADNGASFVVGDDVRHIRALADASQTILREAISMIKGGVKVADVGRRIETLAKVKGYKVIKNLGGHGVGRSLHEEPDCILNYYDHFDRRRFKKDSVVAIETFITTCSTLAVTEPDGWTMVGNKGGFCAQHEHTVLVTSGEPIVLTAKNGI